MKYLLLLLAVQLFAMYPDKEHIHYKDYKNSKYVDIKTEIVDKYIGSDSMWHVKMKITNPMNDTIWPLLVRYILPNDTFYSDSVNQAPPISNGSGTIDFKFDYKNRYGKTIRFELIADDVTPILRNMSFIRKGVLMMKRDNGMILRSYYMSKDIYMDVHETSQKDYSLLMDNPPAYIDSTIVFGRTAYYPMYNVSWYDALRYCNQRSKKYGLDTVYTFKDDTTVIKRDVRGYRLPINNEYVLAVEDTGTKSYNNLESCYYVDHYIRLDLRASSYTRYDGSGCPSRLFTNVKEWMYDAPSYYGSNRRFLFGGSYLTTEETVSDDCSYGLFDTYPPDTTMRDVGFRCVLDAE